ncbi:MAG: hypothetical protein HYT80_03125 [Euryarchaeota archaeon]|nr:hypothetical protein [Euryarchaeota archaeon]
MARKSTAIGIGIVLAALLAAPSSSAEDGSPPCISTESMVSDEEYWFHYWTNVNGVQWRYQDKEFFAYFPPTDTYSTGSTVIHGYVRCVQPVTDVMRCYEEFQIAPEPFRWCVEG